ncbi:MAG: adenine phosphoribosyltransferase [Candidatus Caenarcaniphilales bacterium]|nr:adenine phosphoribosyltransferase [Candidatus Caenarcaniphilales bacterium]
MQNTLDIETLKNRVIDTIREVPDFPKAGINFKDITPILKDIELFNGIIDHFHNEVLDHSIDTILGIESRGFLFGVPLASKLNKPFAPVRKPGKLPAETIQESYTLEYGEDILEVHKDACDSSSERNILIVDDLLATGGTALATYNLAKKLGAENVTLITLIELSFLNGREKLEKAGLNVKSMISY